MKYVTKFLSTHVLGSSKERPPPFKTLSPLNGQKSVRKALVTETKSARFSSSSLWKDYEIHKEGQGDPRNSRALLSGGAVAILKVVQPNGLEIKVGRKTALKAANCYGWISAFQSMLARGLWGHQFMIVGNILTGVNPSGAKFAVGLWSGLRWEFLGQKRVRKSRFS